MKKNNDQFCRLGKVGGQAVLEGVMMKSGDDTCLAVRGEDGVITTRKSKFTSLRKKNKFFNIPVLRGVVNFVEMMMLSMSTLTASAEMLGIDDAEPETKFEKWLTEKLGDKLMAVIMTLATILGVALSIGLFFLIPTYATKGIKYLMGGEMHWALRSAIEGVLKIAIFIGYIAAVSLMKDIRRTFEYHGAEHKCVFCYEKGLELTVENAKGCSRLHPRCGTSFIFVMLFISIFITMFIHIDHTLLRTLVKLLLMPLAIGIGFEFIMFAGKHDNFITRALSAPGLWMQKLTTKEPDDGQLEVAIAALKGAIPAEFPEEAETNETNDTAEDIPSADNIDEGESRE
ncbi:MAG: DUF1385 domain-containing protein [Clostridia bacterium]|nr:DUF1385 domain-containing protein [Clostridia bacterium]